MGKPSSRSIASINAATQPGHELGQVGTVVITAIMSPRASRARIRTKLPESSSLTTRYAAPHHSRKTQVASA